MTEAFFVVGDVHGRYDLMVEILKKWDQQKQQLVFLGDVIDRGEQSRQCLELAKELVEEEGAICLMGNHERMLLAYLRDPENRYDHYHRNGGDTTINSLLGRDLDSPVEPLLAVKELSEKVADLLDFVATRPYYHETDRYIFVHAGLDWSQSDWRKTSHHDLVWLREPFYKGENTTGKTIVFGHTPTYYLFDSPEPTSRLWVTADGKIGADGGAVYGGVLHGLSLDATGLVRDDYIGAATRFEVVT